MAEKMLNTRIQQKRDTSSKWTLVNPILKNGEIAIVDTDSGEIRIKIGNGTAKYTELPFVDEVVRNDLQGVKNRLEGLDEEYLTVENPTGTGSFSMNRREESEIGEFSFAEGNDTTASGAASHAEGNQTQAIGENSHAEGTSNTAFGNNSHAEGGGGTRAYGTGSHAEGSGTQAGDSSLAANQSSNAHAEGGGSRALGMASHAEGSGTTASGSNSHSEGQGTQALGEASHAEGMGTMAYGNQSHVEGAEQTKAYGKGAHAEGITTQAGSDTFSANTNSQAHAEGSYSKALQFASHAEGSGTTASGINSHAEGTGTQAIGNNSHAEGAGAQAIGNNSHAEGESTKAIGNYSHAEGYFITAGSEYQHVQGKYNIEDNENQYAHIVGGGDGFARKNIHTLDWSGNAVYEGTVKAANPTEDNDLTTKQYVQQAIEWATSDANKIASDAYYKASNIIRDNSESSESTWSSEKIQKANSDLNKTITNSIGIVATGLQEANQRINGLIDDQATSKDKTWSSAQIQSHVGTELGKTASSFGETINSMTTGFNSRLDALINDKQTAPNSTWSSEKIDEMLKSAGSQSSIIDDNTTSDDTTWSSSKINAQVNTIINQNYMPTISGMNTQTNKRIDDLINDGSASKTSTYSSDYIAKLISDKTEINDKSTSLFSTWSSTQISSSLDKKASLVNGNVQMNGYNVMGYMRSLGQGDNANNITNNGIYDTSGQQNISNLPKDVAVDGALENIQAPWAGIYIQRYTDSNGKTFVRAKNPSNTWSEWNCLNQPERISNSNGEQIKFPDGTMICTKTVTYTTAINTQDGSMYYGTRQSLGNYAAAFVDTPIVSATLTGATSGFMDAIKSTSSTSVGTVNMYQPTSKSSMNYVINIIAVGRWK